jgi:hypothetical protein
MNRGTVEHLENNEDQQLPRLNGESARGMLKQPSSSPWCSRAAGWSVGIATTTVECIVRFFVYAAAGLVNSIGFKGTDQLDAGQRKFRLGIRLCLPFRNGVQPR